MMKDFTKQERNAIEAVARRFSATWKKDNDSPKIHMMVAGKRVGVDITILKRCPVKTGKLDLVKSGLAKPGLSKPGLRFDRVAIRLLDRVRSSLGERVPEGVTVLLTVTAPIRLPSKTAASLEDKIRILLGRRSPRRDEKDTVCGNHIHIRLLKEGSGRAPKMIGFVHNPDSDPLLLLNMTCELLELSRFAAKSAAPRLAGDRWLVVVSARESSCLEAYRYIYSQMQIPTDFSEIQMMFGDGHLGMLFPTDTNRWEIRRPAGKNAGLRHEVSTKHRVVSN